MATIRSMRPARDDTSRSYCRVAEGDGSAGATKENLPFGPDLPYADSPVASLSSRSLAAGTGLAVVAGSTIPATLPASGDSSRMTVAAWDLAETILLSEKYPAFLTETW